MVHVSNATRVPFQVLATATIITHTQEGIADLFGRDIRIPVAEPLVLLADIGFDIFQLLVDAQRLEAFAGGFVSFGIPKR